MGAYWELLQESLCKIKEIYGKRPGTKVDLTAKVTNVANIQTTSTNKSLRLITVCDESNSIDIKLWGEDAQKCNLRIGETINAKKLSVNVWNKKYTLSKGWNGIISKSTTQIATTQPSTTQPSTGV